MWFLHNTPIEDIMDWGKVEIRGEAVWRFKGTHFSRCPKVNDRHTPHLHAIWKFRDRWRIAILWQERNPTEPRLNELRDSVQIIASQLQLSKSYDHSKAHG